MWFLQLYNQRGSALFYVIITVLLLFLLGMAVISMSESNLRTVRADDDFQAAFHVAEAGIHMAYDELLPEIQKVYRNTLQGAGITAEKRASQIDLQNYIKAAFPNQLNIALKKLDYFTYSGHREVFENFKSQSRETTITGKITLQSTTQPIWIQLKAIAKVGTCRRRVDMSIMVQKTAKAYYNEVFQKTVYAQQAIIVQDGGYLEINGDLLVSPTITYEESIDKDKGIFVTGSGILKVTGKTYAGNHNIMSRDGGTIFLGDEVIGRTLEANGVGAATITVEKDIYVYNDIRANGGHKSIILNGLNLYGVGDDLLVPENSSSLSADSESSIHITNGSFMIAGIEFYKNEIVSAPKIFGMYPFPSNQLFRSPESIGGGNAQFYFTDFITDYIEGQVIPSYQAWGQDFVQQIMNEAPSILPKIKSDIELDTLNDIPGSIELLVQERNNPPQPLNMGDDTDPMVALSQIHFNGYCWQYALYKDDTIQVDHFNPDTCYARGAVLINGQTLYPNNWSSQIVSKQAFFQNKKNEMASKLALPIDEVIDVSSHTNNVNAHINNQILCIEDPFDPFLYINRNQADMILSSQYSPYNGIYYTEGSVIVPPGEEVIFNGLLITKGELLVQGKLSLRANKSIIQNAIQMGGQASGVGDFFKQTVMNAPFISTETKEVPVELQ